MRARVAPGSSMTNYRPAVKTVLKTSMAGVRLLSLTPLHVERACAEMLGFGLSPRTVAHHGVVLGRAIGDAVRYGLLPNNPASATEAKRPRWTAPETRALNAEEARTLMAAALRAEGEGIGAKYARTVELGLATGLRISEVLGLRWEDVSEAAISVRQALRDGKTPCPPKSRAGMRTIPLPGTRRKRSAGSGAGRRSSGLHGGGRGSRRTTSSRTRTARRSANGHSRRGTSASSGR